MRTVTTMTMMTTPSTTRMRTRARTSSTLGRANGRVKYFQVRFGFLVNLKEAKRDFANQNVVCKLRHPETLAFLAKEFGDAGRPLR
jgi:hypothetical protein